MISLYLGRQVFAILLFKDFLLAWDVPFWITMAMVLMDMVMMMIMGMMQMMGIANLFKHPLRVGDARSLLPALPPEGKKKLKRCSFFWILCSATIMLCIQLSEQ